MYKFLDYITEVFDFSRENMELSPETNLIHYHKNGIETVFGHDDIMRRIPFKEFVFHTPLRDMPKDKSNLWVHVMHYPGGYATQGLKKPHLQVHFDVSHVTDHDYLDTMREQKNAERKTEGYDDPGVIYANTFAKQKGLSFSQAAGGNAYSGLRRDTSPGLSFAFKKIAPHIVRSAWHVSKFYPKMPIAFSAGSDVPGHEKRKMAMYNTIADSLKDAGLVHDDSQYVYNPYSSKGQMPMFHVIQPIHK